MRLNQAHENVEFKLRAHLDVYLDLLMKKQLNLIIRQLIADLK